MLGLRGTGIMTTYNKYSKDCASPRSLEKYYSRKKVYIRNFNLLLKKEKPIFARCCNPPVKKTTDSFTGSFIHQQTNRSPMSLFLLPGAYEQMASPDAPT